MTLQGNFFRHLSKDYFALVLIIKTKWKKETIDLADTILRIICHAEINKRNKKDIANNINTLAVGVKRKQALWGMCTNQRCIDRVNTIYYND